MTNDEINRYIHTEIMGKCWHEWQFLSRSGFKVKLQCQFCKLSRYRSGITNNPNYCSDESPRSLLNEVVQRIVNQEGLTIEFNHQLCATEGTTIFAREGYPNAFAVATDIVALTAEQIARACVEAWKNK